jgi:YbbR domain-containing protein
VSERASLWGLRLLALAIAVVLWFFGSVEKRERASEKVVEANITYSTPSGTVILDPVQTVRVRLRGRTSKIRNLNPFVVDVLVVIPEGRHGSLDVHLGPENVIAPEDLEVVSVDPNLLQLHLDREVSVMLPVLPRLAGEPAAGAVVGTIEVSPERVLVNGPESTLRRVRTLSTSPINLSGHALDFVESAAVLAPDPLIKVVQPSVVSVRVPMQPPVPPRTGGGAGG